MQGRKEKKGRSETKKGNVEGTEKRLEYRLVKGLEPGREWMKEDHAHLTARKKKSVHCLAPITGN